MTDAPGATGARSATADATASRPEPARLARWTVTSGSNVNSRAAVVIRAGHHDWKASAEGNGAVDALYKAVDQALADVLGGHPRLVAYDVHALAEGPAAEGRVTVKIAPPPSAPKRLPATVANARSAVPANAAQPSTAKRSAAPARAGTSSIVSSRLDSP